MTVEYTLVKQMSVVVTGSTKFSSDRRLYFGTVNL